jgi:hypothetical protein
MEEFQQLSIKQDNLYGLPILGYYYV